MSFIQNPSGPTNKKQESRSLKAYISALMSCHLKFKFLPETIERCYRVCVYSFTGWKNSRWAVGRFRFYIKVHIFSAPSDGRENKNMISREPLPGSHCQTVKARSSVSSRKVLNEISRWGRCWVGGDDFSSLGRPEEHLDPAGTAVDTLPAVLRSPTLGKAEPDSVRVEGSVLQQRISDPGIVAGHRPGEYL